MSSDPSEQPLPLFQYELVRVAPSEARQRCLALHEEGKGAFTPILLDSPEKFYRDAEQMAELRRMLPATLAAAKAISVSDFLAQRRSADSELYEELEKGEWPAVPDKLEPYLHTQMDEAFIVKVPTPDSYEAPAYIGFGGWNDCPADEEHVAILRYWHERYGANLIAQGGDMLECAVDRPPMTKEAALSLAREQLLYSPGVLTEVLGVDTTIPRLAAALLNSKHWLFWWD